MSNDLSASALQNLQSELAALPQYQPCTRHFFHGGMYCREVWREAGVLVVGAAHKKEHFYVVAQGTVLITDGASDAREVTGPCLFSSMPGSKRAVYAITSALCMTFHRTDATTVEQAEAELVEVDPTSTFAAGNQLQSANLGHAPKENLQ